MHMLNNHLCIRTIIAWNEKYCVVAQVYRNYRETSKVYPDSAQTTIVHWLTSGMVIVGQAATEDESTECQKDDIALFVVSIKPFHPSVHPPRTGTFLFLLVWHLPTWIV